jgi:peptidoglycan/xylan/chitin deacetylase (PgdA/CDA1 family)
MYNFEGNPVIGVITNHSEELEVREFFELFKTPWEFYRADGDYDVVLCTQTKNELIVNCKLIILFNSKKTIFDQNNKIKILNSYNNELVNYFGNIFPVYGEIISFEGLGNNLININGKNASIGFEISRERTKIIRVGYNIFEEISFLLRSGQPAHLAEYPTLDLHIATLRKLIVSTGVPLIEIPPIPEGHEFIVCLTHDVDFVRLSRHRFDHTMFGFFYRAVWGSFRDFFKKRLPLKKLLTNFKAAVLLPGVYLGVVKDYFHQFDNYLKIEQDLPSTFFIMPFSQAPGRDDTGRLYHARASRYDVSDIADDVKRLVSSGKEVGLHGIDAWKDSHAGREELQRISRESTSADVGVRMHWLYFNDKSPRVLDEAGFVYDSTSGYNEAVGFRAGSTQAFRPLDAKNLIELPMHIMDTALFYPGRMNLDENTAMRKIDQTIKSVKEHGGVLTINWHQRSIGPERLWDDHYRNLLKMLKKYNVWFTTALYAACWFKTRRDISFEHVNICADKAHIKLSGIKNRSLPAMLLRMHLPAQGEVRTVDVRFAGSLDTTLSLN